jgi:hypothetical protein
MRVTLVTAARITLCHRVGAWRSRRVSVGQLAATVGQAHCSSRFSRAGARSETATLTVGAGSEARTTRRPPPAAYAPIPVPLDRPRAQPVQRVRSGHPWWACSPSREDAMLERTARHRVARGSSAPGRRTALSRSLARARSNIAVGAAFSSRPKTDNGSSRPSAASRSSNFVPPTSCGHHHRGRGSSKQLNRGHDPWPESAHESICAAVPCRGRGNELRAVKSRP